MLRGKTKITLLVSMFILSFLFLLSNRPLAAEDDSFEKTVTQKLELILNNQAKILTQLETMKAELDIVKIRATQ